MMKSILIIVFVTGISCQQLENNTFRLLFNADPPNVFNCSFESKLQVTYKCPFPGVYSEILKIIFDSIQYKVQLVAFPNTSRQLDYSQMQNVAFYLNDADNQLADGYIGLTLTMDGFYELFDTQSAGITPAEVSILSTSQSDDEISFWAYAFNFTRVYNDRAWFIILLFFLISKCYVKILIFFAKNRQRLRTPKYSKQLMAWIGLFIALLYSLYKSGLLARLLIHIEYFTFTNYVNFLDSVQSGETKIMVQPDMKLLSKLAEPHMFEGSSLKLLKESLQDDSLVYKKQNLPKATIYEIVANSKLVFIQEIWGNYYAVNQHCYLRVLTIPEFDYGYYRLLLSNNLPEEFRKRLDEQINKLYGAFDAVQNRYRITLSRRASNLTCENYGHELRPLNIVSVSGVFILLVAATVAGASFLMVENILKCLGLNLTIEKLIKTGKREFHQWL